MPQGSKWTAIKKEIAPDNKKIIKEHRKLFFKYINERWKIYVRRTAGEKPPWTKDKILLDYHFTNVLREYDRGTQWILNNAKKGIGKIKVVRGKEKLTPTQKMLIIWRVVQYRWPNYHTLYEDHGWIPPVTFSKKKWLKNIEKTKKKHGRWHTTAHIVLQSNFKQSRAENFLYYLDLLAKDYPRFYKGIVEANSMQEAHKHVKSFQGFGDFTAQEVLVDLCLLGVLPDKWRDDWSVAGPGAKEGIDLIYPQAKNAGTAGYTKAMERLRDRQEKYLDEDVPRLALHDIEFNLCEFSKYVKIKHGTGRGRRYRGMKR